MRVSTNWLKDFVTLAPPLERIADRLTMAGLEVKRIEARPEFQDTVFEVEITTNRPDWLSHLGVAREIHAVENTGIKLPPFQNPEHRPMPSGWRLDLKEIEGCPYYTACLLEGVQQAETPDWMRARLLACGIRPIHLIVDITNYVLLEIGQPLHAFDADLLKGQEVVIRRAKPEENFLGIDGKRYVLQPDDLVIADRERAVALAGVMGGRETEVSGRTRNILLESAFFHPRWVRKTSLKLGLSSESSYRFERRVDPEGVDLGRERAIYLLRELAGVRNVSAVIKAGRKPTLAKSKIHLSLDLVEKILGMEMKPYQIHSVLTRLGLEVKKENEENWSIGIPSFRSDLERPVDLVEEVARLVGYGNIPESLPQRPPFEIPSNPLRDLKEKTQNFFSGIGFFETVTFSLTNPSHFETGGIDLKQAVQIHNPIHQELTLLRPSFLVSLLEVLARNERMGERTVPIFEVASLYSRREKGEPPHEEKSVGILAAGEREASWSDPKRAFNFFDLKGVLERYFEFLGIPEVFFSPCEAPLFDHAAQIKLGKETIGLSGRVSQSLQEKWELRAKAFFAEVSLEALAAHLPKGRRFKGIPRFPAAERDLSLVVDEGVQVQEIAAEITRLGKDLIRDIQLFDLYRGGRIPAGRKNLAFRILYQSLERTLLSEEIQALHNRIASELAQKFQAGFQTTK